MLVRTSRETKQIPPCTQFWAREPCVSYSITRTPFSQCKGSVKGVIPIFWEISVVLSLIPACFCWKAAVCQTSSKIWSEASPSLGGFALGVYTFGLTFVPPFIFPCRLLIVCKDLSGQIWQHFHIYLDLYNINWIVGSFNQAPLAAHTRIMLFYYVCTREVALAPHFIILDAFWRLCYQMTWCFFFLF